MNFIEAMSDALVNIAHGEGGRTVKTIWTDLRTITDRYSFRCGRCRYNDTFRVINNFLRWWAREDTKLDEADLWTKATWLVNKEKTRCSECANCKFKL